MAENRGGEMIRGERLTLDRQYSGIPGDVVYCSNCVVSNQRPRTRFNEAGVCSACQWAWEKDHVIDWEARAKELEVLCDRHRSNDGSFDVVVPGSGGKDSAFVAHHLKTMYGMNPLCVTWAPFAYTGIGWENLMKFIDSGFTNITGQPGGELHRKLARLAFDLKGDPWEPFSVGQKSWAFHIATRWGIKLIMYGENGELEYGGSEKYKYQPKEGPEEWTEEYTKGSTIDELTDVGLQWGILDKGDLLPHTLDMYKSPPMEEVVQSGCEMHWYSYYVKWVPEENYYYAVNNTGFQPNPEGRSEGTYTKYVSLDDRLDGFHWYMAWIKFGMGRASRDAQTDIRRHHITREEGVALVRRYDGEMPIRQFKWFLDYININEEYFWEVCDFYRSMSNAWEQREGIWMLKAVVS